MAVSSSGYPLGGMERRCVVDLLPDRSENTFAAWLIAHPGAEIISRDRGGDYAEGARRGAPQAMQIADRFHLLRNLRDVTLRVCKRHAKRIAQVPTPGATVAPLTRLRLAREASREWTRTQMRTRHEAIQRLASQGMKGAAIARALGIHRHTVRKYLEAIPRPNGGIPHAGRAR